MLYHTDQNVLLGAPTGSGKTISAELAMLHLFNTQPDMKVVLSSRALQPSLPCSMLHLEISLFMQRVPHKLLEACYTARSCMNA